MYMIVCAWAGACVIECSCKYLFGPPRVSLRLAQFCPALLSFRLTLLVSIKRTMNWSKWALEPWEYKRRTYVCVCVRECAQHTNSEKLVNFSHHIKTIFCLISIIIDARRYVRARHTFPSNVILGMFSIEKFFSSPTPETTPVSGLPINARSLFNYSHKHDFRTIQFLSLHSLEIHSENDLMDISCCISTERKTDKKRLPI